MFKLSTISGQVHIKFYKTEEEDKKNLMESAKTNAFMGDSEFVFPIQSLKDLNIKEMYALVRTENV